MPLPEPIPAGYQCEPEVYESLCNIRQRLYGNGAHMSADARRDLAHQLWHALTLFFPVYDE